jgi:hypothetical protein
MVSVGTSTDGPNGANMGARAGLLGSGIRGVCCSGGEVGVSGRDEVGVRGRDEAGIGGIGVGGVSVGGLNVDGISVAGISVGGISVGEVNVGGSGTVGVEANGDAVAKKGAPHCNQRSGNGI